MPLESNNKMEMHPHFPSGAWEGFYVQNNVNHKMECNLEFKNNQIKGGGNDELGGFSWKGSYDTEAGSVNMTKSYFNAHDVHYKGLADENGIWGNWEINSSYTDGFHIWPKKGESNNVKKEVKENAKTVEKKLKITKKL